VAANPSIFVSGKKELRGHDPLVVRVTAEGDVISD